MPEGDTIHRAARSLRAVLLDRPVTRFDAPRLTVTGPLPGTTVTGVEARGKHLLIHFSDRSVLHTHLRMTGSWHTYPLDARWQRPRSQVRAAIETPEAVAVCFNAPIVELLSAEAIERHPALRALGPDLLDDPPDLDVAVQRMATIPEPDTEIVDVLLDQRVAAGIGNVYKSELLFLRRIHPRTPLREVPEDERLELLRLGAALLARNLHTSRRTTVRGARDGTLYVYGRAGQPCRRCGTPVESQHQGDHARITYWCPACQRASDDPSASQRQEAPDAPGAA